jgi:hypothetical protein
VRGQNTQRLSEHYRLECDYGTSILTVYNEGDPVFLCESHVSAITPRDNCIAGVRPVEVKHETGNGGNGVNRGIEAGAAEIALIATAAAGAPCTAPTAVSAISDSPAASVAEQPPNSGNSAPQPKTDFNPNNAAEGLAAVVVPGELGSTAATADICVPLRAQEPTQHTQLNAANASVSAAETSLPNRGPVAARIIRHAPASNSRTPVRDLTYGNAAKALVDETIWNMASGDLDAYRRALERGKTATEAAQAAGGQMAVIQRKIAEYTAKIEPMLSTSKASISIGYAIDKPLEQAILEIIGSLTMGDAEKDAAVAQLGALQEQIKGGLQREITPLQAYGIAREIGERVNWGIASGVREEVKHAYRGVYTRLREALRAFVPEARELDERLCNLYVAKSDLENAASLKTSRSAAV